MKTSTIKEKRLKKTIKTSWYKYIKVKLEEFDKIHYIVWEVEKIHVISFSEGKKDIKIDIEGNKIGNKDFVIYFPDVTIVDEVIKQNIWVFKVIH